MKAPRARVLRGLATLLVPLLLYSFIMAPEIVSRVVAIAPTPPTFGTLSALWPWTSLPIAAGLVASSVTWVLIARRNERRWDTVEPPGTYRAKPLMTPWEQSAMRQIMATLPPGLYACRQVRLADLLSVRWVAGPRHRFALGKITRKSLDFAIIQADGVVLLAVELTDKTHELPERQQRDRFVRDALRQASIPLATFEPGERINVAQFLPH